MLKNTDTSQKLKKKEYKSDIITLGLRLSEMQRICKDESIPVTIIFEGWSAAGKGSRISSLIKYLDPRGFEVFTIQKTTEDERLRPFMWRFWQRAPAKGRFHIFDRSWYQALMRGQDKHETLLADPVYDIKSFEKTSVDNGAVIIKLFLHVSKKEQKKRLRALEDNSETAWRVSPADWYQNRHYKKTLSRFEHMLQDTDHNAAPWTVIEANNSRFADIKVYKTVVSALEKAVKARQDKSAAINVKPENIKDTTNNNTNKSVKSTESSTLANTDLTIAIGREEYISRLRKAQNELAALHNAMYKQRVPAAMVFEGWDAAGKGGAITRAVATLDPRGYKVAPFGAPNDIENAHHYLWRFWNEVPKAGHMTVFDRSWYGRVMVERVEGFCKTADWKRAFEEINDFEKQLTDSGIVLLKFWLHISPEEQLKRFELRTNTPEKAWKITDEDWRNREKWDQYLEAVDDMLRLTSTEYAPWTIIEAVDKLYARVKVAETAKNRLESALE
ncbi:MAG: polyphosphate:AMP phosphotransferase [Oscillospiraceae bacterium]|jgi:polyphosphate:AMP phosphotransferase|nr:polyphosphate:AMP phosphotransferase [Oscillospiraceae bacterium]